MLYKGSRFTAEYVKSVFKHMREFSEGLKSEMQDTKPIQKIKNRIVNKKKDNL